MKKSILSGLLLAVACMMASGCSSCQPGKQKQDKSAGTAALYHDYDGVVQDFSAGVSQIQALHRQTMYALIGSGRYEWRNSRVIFNETLTAENIDDIRITDVNDVFFYWQDGPWVQYVNSNVKTGLQVPWPIQDIWIEDDNLEDKPIMLSAEDAIRRLKEWNGILPASEFITLRMPVGPFDCNPQWTFGDTYDVVFIDAVTGEVSDSNPAFRPKPGTDDGNAVKP